MTDLAERMEETRDVLLKAGVSFALAAEMARQMAEVWIKRNGTKEEE